MFFGPLPTDNSIFSRLPLKCLKLCPKRTTLFWLELPPEAPLSMNERDMPNMSNRPTKVVFEKAAESFIRKPRYCISPSATFLLVWAQTAACTGSTKNLENG
ncbi:unnamed protein product, partial [Ectocarpus sp. 8 AP-2014]